MDRRHILEQMLSAGAIAAVAVPTAAHTAPSLPAEMDDANRLLFDRLAVGELVARERAARDAGSWDEMAACWHPEATVEVSWFKGSGKQFVVASARVLSEERLSLHQLGPTTARIRGDHATAETPCQLLTFVKLSEVEVCLVGNTRLVWRARKSAGRWLIAGLRMIYIRDLLTPCVPGVQLIIDAAELTRYRRSYRFLSYVLARSPNRPRDDLPGTDRPDSIASLRMAEAGWLAATKKSDQAL